MNHMAEVAKMLGVELGEEFEIKMPNSSCYTKAMFTDNGLNITDHNILDTITWKPYVLGYLLNGSYTIKHKPWMPQYEEPYYYVEEDTSIRCEQWYYDAIDLNFYKLGNCYRTREEAEANCDKWFEFYASDEVLEV